MKRKRETFKIIGKTIAIASFVSALVVCAVYIIVFFIMLSNTKSALFNAQKHNTILELHCDYKSVSYTVDGITYVLDEIVLTYHIDDYVFVHQCIKNGM